jgi:hypothetical protein
MAYSVVSPGEYFTSAIVLLLDEVFGRCLYMIGDIVEFNSALTDFLPA